MSKKKKPAKPSYKKPPAPKIPAIPTPTFYGKAINTITPDSTEFNQAVNDVYLPQERNLFDTYNRTLGNTAGNANALGVLNSIGFQNYKQNTLDKNLAESRADTLSESRNYVQDYIKNLVQQDFANRVETSNMTNNYNFQAATNQNNFNSSLYGSQLGYDASMYATQQANKPTWKKMLLM